MAPPWSPGLMLFGSHPPAHPLIYSQPLESLVFSSLSRGGQARTLCSLQTLLPLCWWPLPGPRCRDRRAGLQGHCNCLCRQRRGPLASHYWPWPRSDPLFFHLFCPSSSTHIPDATPVAVRPPEGNQTRFPLQEGRETCQQSFVSRRHFQCDKGPGALGRDSWPY